MPGSSEWVLLAYKLPREPSSPRVDLWRKLRRLGAAQIVDGLVALPAEAPTREQFDWLADEIVEAGGEAGTWIARTGTLTQENQLTSRMAEAIASEYREVIVTAKVTLRTSDPVARRRNSARLSRELRRIGARDFFPPAERGEAEAAVAALATTALEKLGVVT